MRKTLHQTALIAVVLLLIWWQAGLWYQSRLNVDEQAHVADTLDQHGYSLGISISQRLEMLEGLHAFIQADLVVNGREVLNRLEQRSYDAVLMDIQMPEMDGLEAAKFIRRSLPAASQPRIIAMTAYAMKGDREQCLAAGMDEYIAKPVKMEELKRVLERLVQSG